MKTSCPERLVEHFGTMPLAASALSEAAQHANPRVRKLSKQAIHTWCRQGYIPEMYALAAERVTNKKITARMVLREAEQARRLIAEQRG